MNNKENNFPIEPVTEGILKHMTSPTGNIKSAKIFTKKPTHLLIFQKRIRKRTTKTKIPSPSPEKKVNPVLETCSNIWRRLRIPSPKYKLIYQSLRRTNTTYQNQMESHTQINYFHWRKTNRVWNLKRIHPNRLYYKTKERIDTYTRR